MPHAAVAPFLAPVVRGWFRAAAVVAPEHVDRQIVRLWATPARTRRSAHRARATPPWWIASGTSRIAVYSEGWGPTVLLAHGWSGNAHDMQTIADELRGRGFRVVTFDMPA